MPCLRLAGPAAAAWPNGRAERLPARASAFLGAPRPQLSGAPPRASSSGACVRRHGARAEVPRPAFDPKRFWHPPETYTSEKGERALFHTGENLRILELPEGTRVIYAGLRANAPRDRKTMEAMIAEALENPVGPSAEGLTEKLRKLKAANPNAKILLSFDDVSVPLPPMQPPDIRGLIMEAAEARCVAAGITDIQFVCSIALHRFVRPDELRDICGPKLFDKYYPAGRIRNYNAVDDHESTHIGYTRHNEDVKICSAFAEADLVIYANINYVAMDGGYKSYATGLVHYDSLRHNHDSQTLAATRSLYDPGRSPMHKSFERMGRMMAKHTEVFHVETVVDENRFPWYLAWVQILLRRMNWMHKAMAWISCIAMQVIPLPVRKWFFWSPLNRAPFGLVRVTAGETVAVHERTLQACYEDKVVDVEGQADVLILAASAIGPYTKDCYLNPLLVNTYILGYWYNMYVGGVPLLKKGGVVVAVNDMPYAWSSPAHDGYRKFFEEVLEQQGGKDFEKHQAKFASDEALNDIYRRGQGPAGVHAFYMYTWAAHGMAEVGKVVVVGAQDPRGPRVLGWEMADSVVEAVAKAKVFLNKPDAQVTFWSAPPPGYARVLPRAGAEAEAAAAAAAAAAAQSTQAGHLRADQQQQAASGAASRTLN